MNVRRMDLVQYLQKATNIPRAIRRLGLATTMRLVATHLVEFGSPAQLSRDRSLWAVQPKGCAHRIHYRVHSSDINVLQEVFLSGDYDCVGSELDTELIVDCGANIGCTSVYFLNRYPKARVVAVEADARNIEVCRLNLRPYGDRALTLHGAIWPRSEPLTVERRDNQEWGFFVRRCRDGEPKEIEVVSLAEILEQSQRKQIDILKIDIEGGESELFANVESCWPWLSRTRTIVIEVHGERCLDIFLRTVESHQFRVDKVGENVMLARNHTVPNEAHVKHF